MFRCTEQRVQEMTDRAKDIYHKNLARDQLTEAGQGGFPYVIKGVRLKVPLKRNLLHTLYGEIRVEGRCVKGRVRGITAVKR